MTTISYIGFHTCKLKGEYEQVSSAIPFLSGSSNNQWLTQGYYFWTDSDYWAKRWGKQGERVIGNFTIELCPKTELLDLVGNVNDQLEFIAYKNKLLSTLTTSQKKKITVNQIISYVRNKQLQHNGFFPYLAIKAEDGRKAEQIPFIDHKLNKFGSSQRLVTPQQLCVFEEARCRIKLVGFVEPNEYVERFSA